MTEWKISGHARKTSHCFHWKMLVYVSYSKYKIFGLCTGDCSLFIFVIYQKGLDRRERRFYLNSQRTRWGRLWRYVSEGCNSLLIGFIQTNCSWSGVRGGLGWILPPEGGWALSRLPLAVVTTPNCRSSRSVWMTLFRHTVGFWGLSCAGPGADSMISVSLSQFRGFCDSVTQVLINARRVCFTAQTVLWGTVAPCVSILKWIRYSSKLVLKASTAGIWIPWVQGLRESKSLFLLLYKILRQDAACCRPNKPDTDLESQGGFAVGGSHRRLWWGERCNKPTQWFILRNRTHPVWETGWEYCGTRKGDAEGLSCCHNFVLFII